jgi:hypothetical protein
MIVRLASDPLANPAIRRAVEGIAAIPDDVKAYFRSIYDMNARRNATILDGLAAALARLQDVGIEPVLLKGAASLVSGLYDDPVKRILSDIDLLISSRQIKSAEAALRPLGYTDLPSAGPRPWVKSQHRHIPPLVPPPEVSPSSFTLH